VTNNDLAEVTVKSLFGSKTEYVVVTNNASIDGGAFQGARGNISANVASGSGNMQRNSLSMAVAR